MALLQNKSGKQVEFHEKEVDYMKSKGWAPAKKTPEPAPKEPKPKEAK